MLTKGRDEFFWANKDKVKVDDIEIKNGKLIPTADLLEILEQKYPDFELHFVMGSDLVYHYVDWEDGQKLKERFNFIIVERQGYLDYPPENLPDSRKMIDMAVKCEVSSTELRRRIGKHINQNHLGLQGLTTKGVIGIIKDHRLFMN